MFTNVSEGFPNLSMSRSLSTEKAMFSSVKKELKKYCKKTSLKILPRLNASSSYGGQFFWFIIFIVFFGTAFMLVFFLTQDYFNFETHMETKLQYGKSSPFPYVTICPHQPISTAGLKKLKSFTPKKYAELSDYYLLEYQEKWLANRSDNLTELPIPLPKFTQFYQALPNRTLASQIGQKHKDFVFECLVDVGSSALVSSPGKLFYCDEERAHIVQQTIMTTEFLNCFQFSFTEPVLNHANKMHFILNLENYISTKKATKDSVKECQQCIRWQPNTWRHGARVLVHSANTLPDVVNSGFDVSPGSINQITVRSIRNHLMEPPYGECNSTSRPTIEDKGAYFNFSQKACMNQLFQTALKRVCQCVDPSLPLAKADEPKNVYGDEDRYSYCEHYAFQYYNRNFTKLEEHLEKNLCLIRMRKEFAIEETMDNCRNPCDYYSHKSSISQTSSFDLSMLPWLYEELKYYGKLKQVIPEMEKVEELYQRENYDEALETLYSGSYFRNNFVVIEVKREDFNLEKQTEHETFPLRTLMSMIGGVCSLFIGFSVVVFVEVGELLLKIFEVLCVHSTKNVMVTGRKESNPEDEATHENVRQKMDGFSNMTFSYDSQIDMNWVEESYQRGTTF